MLSPQDEEFLRGVKERTSLTGNYGFCFTQDETARLLCIVNELNDKIEAMERIDFAEKEISMGLEAQVKHLEKERDGLREELEIRTCPSCSKEKP